MDYRNAYRELNDYLKEIEPNTLRTGAEASGGASGSTA